MELTPEEVRVLGCLVEKQRTTPDAYPLTLNALVAACNQTTNRDPVVAYDEATVEAALDGLRARGLSGRTVERGGRVTRHRHLADRVLGVDDAEAAVLAVLALRGAQTPGELKARTARLHDVGDLDALERILVGLRDRPSPLVARLPREAGRKEHRWVTTLAGPVGAADAGAGGPPPGGPGDPRDPGAAGLEARVARLEAEVARLAAALDGLAAPGPG